MDYREEYRSAYGQSSSSSRGEGTQSGSASGEGFGGTNVFDDEGTELTGSESWSAFASNSFSESASWSESETTSKSAVPMLIPVMGKELSHVQFRSLEEQLFRAMAVLFDQQERQGVARVVGMNAPVSIFTPPVKEMPEDEKITRRFLAKCYKKWPFALRASKARERIAARSRSFAERILEDVGDEPKTSKRRIR